MLKTCDIKRHEFIFRIIHSWGWYLIIVIEYRLKCVQYSKKEQLKKGSIPILRWMSGRHLLSWFWKKEQFSNTGPPRHLTAPTYAHRSSFLSKGGKIKYVYIQYPVEIRDVYKIQKPSNPEQNVLHRIIWAHKIKWLIIIWKNKKYSTDYIWETCWSVFLDTCE